MNNLVKQVEEKDINEVKEYVAKTLEVTKQQIDKPDESVRYYPTLKLTTLEVPATLILSMIKLLDHYQEQPKLSIPKKIADKLDNEDANSKSVLDWVFATGMIVVNNEKALKRREDEILKRRAIVSIYGASKALGVELVEVEG